MTKSINEQIKNYSSGQRIVIDIDSPVGTIFSLMAIAKKLGDQLGFDSKKILKEMQEFDYSHALRVFERNFGEYTSLQSEYNDVLPAIGSYWENKGKYQSEWDNMYDELVPDCGVAKTVKGELIRLASGFYYENFNNGNTNAREEFEEYDDEGELVEEYYELSVNTNICLDMMKQVAPQLKTIISDMKECILGYGRNSEEVYEELINAVAEFCLGDNPILDKTLKEVCPRYAQYQEARW
jgi:hypothetical protein